MKAHILTIILTGVLNMGLFSFLTACGEQKTARISILSSFSNDMEYVGTQEASEPRAEPVPKEFTVKVGESVYNDSIKILKISDDGLTFEMYMEYISYSDKIPKRKFTVEKGETLTIYQYGLCDATQGFTITYIE
ncbi:MAG: hypothetical protein ACI4KM_03330 [Oscillospiraceae bacterium]